MDANAIGKSLARLPHFQGLDAERLARIIACSRLKTYSSGESVFIQGETCRAFFVIESGGVRLYRLTADGKQQVVHDLQAGQSFAEAAMFQFGLYPVHCDATEAPTELIEVDADRFLRLFREDSRIAEIMVGSLCQRLFRLVSRIEELTVVSASARLARYVLNLPSSGPHPIEVELPFSKKHLAGHLSITPETLSRLLTKWRKRGFLESQGRRLIVHHVDTLEAIADGAKL
ncbi:MAG: Crp/Fnr family transcriptional regulator [Planctomycetota bacterium]|nr:MAG: Crp/Fnr family transcriptional regulator [Planctomycetota bacterium]